MQSSDAIPFRSGKGHNLSVHRVEDLLPEQPLRTGSLVSLNFKVPLRLRLEFKVYAAHHNMTMTDLLLQLFEERLFSEKDHEQTFINLEIKK
jgi:hypothetical protein